MCCYVTKLGSILRRRCPGRRRVALGTVALLPTSDIMGQTIVLDNAEVVGNNFVRCRIIYRGGPTVVRNNLFIDCVFEIHVSTIPPPDGQRLGKALLAGDLSRIASDTPWSGAKPGLLHLFHFVWPAAPCRRRPSPARTPPVPRLGAS